MRHLRLVHAIASDQSTSSNTSTTQLPDSSNPNKQKSKGYYLFMARQTTAPTSSKMASASSTVDDSEGTEDDTSLVADISLVPSRRKTAPILNVQLPGSDGWTEEILLLPSVNDSSKSEVRK